MKEFYEEKSIFTRWSKVMMSFGVSAMMIFCLNPQLFSQEVTILDEALRDGSLPAGWTAVEIDFQTGAGGYARFDETTSVLTSPVLDLTEYDNVQLEFDVAKWGSGDDGPVTVQVSDDGGATWTAQEFDSPTPTGSSYMTSGPTLITATGDNVMIRIIRDESPSRKRLRDFLLTGDGDPPAEEVTILDLPYLDDFSTNPLTSGWKDRNIVGDQEWDYGANFNNISFSAFSGDCQENENWLVSPGFDLTITDDELLSFDVARGFSGDNDLEVLYSTDYSGLGDPNSANWTSITTVTNDYFDSNSIPNNAMETFGGFDDLEGLADTVFVAFKFVYTSGGCATWRIGDFSLLEVEGPPSLTAINDPYLQDFGGFDSETSIPAGWAVSNSSYNGDWGTGTAGGLRGNDNVLGFQHTGGTGTFTATLSLINDTGAGIEQLELSYEGKVERANQGRSPEWEVRVNGTLVPALFYSTSAGVDEEITAIVSGIFIPEGDLVEIEWSSDRGQPSGASKQIGIADVSVTALEAPALSQPVFDLPSDTYFEDQTVFVSNFDQYSPVIEVRYTVDGTEPDSNSPLYDDAVGMLVEDGNGVVTLNARAINTAAEEESGVTTADYVFPVNIPDIATLRDQPFGSTLYRLTSEPTLIGQTGFRNTKFFQDATGGIQIDDAPNGIFGPGIIQTEYEIGDNVTGIVGTLGAFQGQVQLVAAVDPGAPVSSGNVVVPAERTLDELTAEDQSTLVRVTDVEFFPSVQTEFGGGGSQYAITDPSLASFTGLFRNVFGESDITGSPIPTNPVNIVGVIQENNAGLNLAARSLDDFTERVKVSGVVAREFGDPVSDVELELINPEVDFFTTGANGFYEFFMDVGDNVLIEASKDGDPAQFITTLDLVTIQQHILDINPFDSPYKIIASDASNNGLVSTFDLVLLQTVIVGILEEIPADVWRFIPENYQFDDPMNPFAEDFPEFVTFQGLTESKVENWVAIKTGDVVNTNGTRLSNEAIAINVNLEHSASGLSELVFSNAQDAELFGYQMALEIHNDLEVVEFIPSSKMEGMNELNFAFIDGTIRTNYINGNGLVLEAGSELFRLRIKGELNSNSLDAAISLDRDDQMRAEAYSVSGEMKRVVIQTDFIQEKEQWGLIGISPVPARDQINLEITTQERVDLEVQIFNINGQFVRQLDFRAESGTEVLPIEIGDLVPGQYFVRSVSAEKTEVLPFVKMN